MKKIIFTLTICLIAISSSFSQDLKSDLGKLNTTEWQKYKSEDLAFVAMFPKKPERTVQKIPTAVGELDMHMVMYSPNQGEDDNAGYSVIRTDYPQEQFSDISKEESNSILDGAVNGAVDNVKGTLVYDNKTSLNGYPGRDIKIQIGLGYIYINAFLVENTMYITQVVCETDNDGNKYIKRFMDSFNIIKVK